MGINIDANKKFEDKTVRNFIFIIVATVTICIISLIVYLSIEDKDYKIGNDGLEVNTPKQSNDTTRNSVSIHQLNGDYVNGNKTVNNNFQDTTKKSK